MKWILFQELSALIKSNKIIDKTMKHFFKATTTSEEKSVTESDSAAKLNDSACESEEEKKNETLNEKIDRLASENSENDEDFDVSDQVSYFRLTSGSQFLILDAIIKFIVDSSGVSCSQSICEFGGNSVTWPSSTDSPQRLRRYAARFICIFSTMLHMYVLLHDRE